MDYELILLLGKLEFELSQPPEGLVIKSVSPAAQASDIVLESDAAKVRPGLKGNLIIKVFGERTGVPDKD